MLIPFDNKMMRRSSTSKNDCQPLLQLLGEEKRLVAEVAEQARRELVVNFACFITCMMNNNNKSEEDHGNAIIEMKIHGFELNCISVAVNRNQAIELYLECDGIPLTRLLTFFEEMLGLVCISIFTFGPMPRTNGAPEALARIRYRIARCGFIGYTKGIPCVEECLDFDIRDVLSNWVRFTADQMGFMLLADGSKPNEIVEWCVVSVSGDTSKLESRLRGLNWIKSGTFRQYYIKGFECMRMPMASRIYIEIEPIVKTVLLRCLAVELLVGSSSSTSSSGRVEILTFPPNQQFKALAYVSELGGVLFEKGNLTAVDVPSKSPVSCVITRFTQNDLATWECVVNEAAPLHWSMRERDSELARLRADIAVLQMENSLLRNESTNYNQQCARFICALNELKADRERLRSELDAVAQQQTPPSQEEVDEQSSSKKNYSSSFVFGWSEWETLRVQLEAKDGCISQLKKQLCESDDQIQRLQRGEMVSDDQGLWFCVDGGGERVDGGGPPLLFRG